MAAEDYGPVGGVEVEVVGLLCFLFAVIADEYLDRGETLSI
ncbi:MAG: hypothetical protein AABX62_01150 [Thermoproteota archaeon]